MEKMVFSKDDLNDLHGLSCIENYFLYTLKQGQHPYKLLFYESFMPLHEIVDFFCAKNAQYAYFSGVTRLHDLAEEWGIVSKQTYPYFDPVLFDGHECICVMVNPEYVKVKYRTELWREDHFILLRRISDNQFYYLNDTPRDVGIMTYGEVRDVFFDCTISFDIQKFDYEKLKIDFFIKFMSDICVTQRELKREINDTTIARDVMGIYRVLCRRMYDFTSLYTDVEWMLPYLRDLDKQYAMLEYMRIRRKMDSEKIKEVFSSLNQKEYKNVLRIKEELERVREY